MSSSRTLSIPIRKRFGKFDLKNAFNLVFSARKGLTPRVFYEFSVSIKMPEAGLASIINLSARTIANYKAGKKKLDPAAGEHLLKLIALYSRGEELFGTVDEFNYWLQKPVYQSADRSIDWLKTPGGVDLVKDELERVAEGYPI